MRRWTKIIVFICSNFLLFPICAISAAQVNDEPTPYTTTDAKGNRWSGSRINNQWHGSVEITMPDGSRCTGPMVDNEQDGLWSCHHTINDLTFYSIYAAGKLLKNFSELEPIWAVGNYEEAFRIRGKKSLLGISLKPPENTQGILVVGVQIHSPAFIAGFQVDDTILSFNGEPALDYKSLIGKIIGTPFGQTVNVDILRNGKQLSLSLIPGTIPRNFVSTDGRSITASAELLRNYYRNFDSAEGYAKYLEFIADETYKPEMSSLLQTALKRERIRIQSSVRASDISELATYLKTYPTSPLRKEAIIGANGILQKSKSKSSVYLAFVERCPTCAVLLPAEYAILAVGPTGMTVSDLLRLSEQGIGADVIAAKIEGSVAEYKDFSFEEIAFLDKLRVPSSVVSAMIRSTHANAGKKLQEQNRQLKEENTALQKQAADKNAAPKLAAAGEGTSVMEECLKLNAALAACDQSGGFLKTGCRLIAQSSFQCPLPSNR